MGLLLAILIASGYGGYRVYAAATGLNEPPPVAPTYSTASQTTLTTSVSTSGSVEASQQVTLNFDIGTGTGEITELLVNEGENVEAGQVLARIDDTNLQKTLDYAQSDLTVAQTRYSEAFEGPSASDITSAQQSITSAESQLLSAQQNLEDVLASPTAAQIAAAQQSVLQAQNSLQSALDAKTKAQETIVTDQKNVDEAEDNLATAQKALDDAEDDLDAAYDDLGDVNSEVSAQYSSLQYAHNNLEDALDACGPSSGSSPRSVPRLPSRGSEATSIVSLSFGFECATPATDEAKASAASQVSQWIGSYNGTVSSYNSSLSTTSQDQAVESAQSGVDSAEAAVKQAQNSLDAAQQTLANDLNTLNNGNLDRSIESAQLGLTTAQQDLSDTLAGPKEEDIESASLSVESAQSSLTSAQARYDELFEGPTLDVSEPLRVAVDQAQTAVDTAQKQMDAATITAPFNGVITEANAEVGDEVAAADAVLVLLNPDLIRIDANVDQADVGDIAVGQTAEVTFDAIAAQTYQAVVSAVGLTPTVTSGVVTYVVSLSMDTSTLAEGIPVPSPGMTATISITTSTIANAIVIPSQAVTSSGGSQTVTVHTDDGDEERQVTTGVTSGTQVQIVSGLSVGEQVLVPTTSTGTGEPSTGTQFGGGIQNGGGFPGGGVPGGGFAPGP